MNTTRSVELVPYRMGDIDKVRCSEPDPFEGWPEFAERYAHDLRSIRLGGELIACLGYIYTTPDDVEGFAVINRDAAAGYGSQVAAIFRQRTRQWITESGIKRAWATCSCEDRAAQVFLRAVGYRLFWSGGDEDHIYLINEGD